MGVLSNYGRTCEGCGSRMPPFFPRKRDDEGKLLCDICLDRKTTAQARAMLHAARQQGRKLAHDSGDGETIYHCPFCGAGQVTGRSDGTAECGFCGTSFTVQVQPKQPSQPQTIDGEPQKMPDMPGEQPGVPELDEEPVEEETELEPGEGEDNLDDMGTDPAEEGNPFLEKKPAYRTVQGALLSEDEYIRHLAIRHAEDRDSVIAEVRAARER